MSDVACNKTKRQMTAGGNKHTLFMARTNIHVHSIYQSNIDIHLSSLPLRVFR